MTRNASEVAANILKQCEELCQQALEADLDVLAHLLSMTMLQAAKDLTLSKAGNASRVE